MVNNEVRMRSIIFRPTMRQLIRLSNIMDCGNFKTESEFMRIILNEGLDKYELKTKKETKK